MCPTANFNVPELGMLEGLPRPLELSRMEARPIGDDVLLQAYLHEP